MILDKSAAMIIQTGRSAVILHDRLLPAKTVAMKCNPTSLEQPLYGHHLSWQKSIMQNYGEAACLDYHRGTLIENHCRRSIYCTNCVCTNCVHV